MPRWRLIRSAGSALGPARTFTRNGASRAFFEQLPEGVAERIEAVAIDMTTAYELEIKEQCSQAEIVFDLYHVVAKYGREVSTSDVISPEVSK